MFGIDDAALAAMLAGAISTAGNLYINKKNRDAQADANAINWEIARQNNATQIEMANTAHQREVRDLRAAGLNPILSAGGRGAAVPSLQAPTIDPVHQDSPFEGLANSAKGMERYLSQEYKTQLAATELANQGQEISNKSGAIDLKTQRIQSRADRLNAQSELMEAELNKDAMDHLFGNKHVQTDAAGSQYTEYDWKAYDRLKALQAEAIQSGMKVRANQNWRSNLSSFVPFTSPTAVSSGVNSAIKLRRLK